MKALVVLITFLVNSSVAVIWSNLGWRILATGLFVAAVGVKFAADPVAIWLVLPLILLQLSVMHPIPLRLGAARAVEQTRRGETALTQPKHIHE